jgi:hypothetical protein
MDAVQILSPRLGGFRVSVTCWLTAYDTSGDSKKNQGHVKGLGWLCIGKPSRKGQKKQKKKGMASKEEHMFPRRECTYTCTHCFCSQLTGYLPIRSHLFLLTIFSIADYSIQI